MKAKTSYDRDKLSIHNLKRLLGEETKIKDLNSGKVEGYQRKRLLDFSPVHPGETVKPATVNREVSCLKTMLNRAVRHGKLDLNPVNKVKKLIENNIRMRILTQDDFNRLLQSCSPHLRPLVIMAYYTGMRKSEILYLTWDEVDLEKGFIRLQAERTKTKAQRSIPLHPIVKEVLASLPKAIHSDRVFLFEGIPFSGIKKVL